MVFKSFDHKQVKEFKPDIILVGFGIFNTGEEEPKMNLNNIHIPLYLILNKEYAGMTAKLNWIKNIKPAPKKVFTVHHDIQKYQEQCNIPFCRIMWSADHNIFKKYTNDYQYDLFFSGVIREEQTLNLRNKIYHNLDKLTNYKLLINASFFQNNKGKGKLYNFDVNEYAKKINQSKIVLTTTGPADLVM